PAAERFDPATGQWTLWGNLVEARVGHSAVRLRDGRVLMSGGFQCCKRIPGGFRTFVTDTAEVFDPVSKTSRSVGRMTATRGLHQSTLLDDGRVLLTGGGGDEGDPTT